MKDRIKLVGKIVKRHPSNMCTTDTEINVPAGNEVAVGDFVVTINGHIKFISAKEFPEVRKEIDKQEKEEAKNKAKSAPATNTGSNGELETARSAVTAAEEKAAKEEAERLAAEEELAAAKEKLAAFESAAENKAK